MPTVAVTTLHRLSQEKQEVTHTRKIRSGRVTEHMYKAEIEAYTQPAILGLPNISSADLASHQEAILTYDMEMACTEPWFKKTVSASSTNPRKNKLFE
jgi:hypothetical protein